MKHILQRLLAAAALCVAAASASAQYTTVSAQHLQDATGNPVANATISFTPTNNAGTVISFRAGGTGGQTIGYPVSTLVTNGVFSITLADTTLTDPINVCYSATLTSNITGKALPFVGYSCIQPSGSTWNFDAYIPNSAPNAVVVAGPTGPVGPACSTGSGTCAMTVPITGPAASFSSGLSDGNKLQVAPVAVPSALAVYDMRQASSTAVTDITGNGNNCTFGAGTQAPTLAGGLLNFNQADWQYCTSVAMSAWQTIIMKIQSPVAPTAYYSTLFGSTVDGTCDASLGVWNSSTNTISSGLLGWRSATQSSALAQPVAGDTVITFVRGATDTWYINGVLATASSAISTMSSCSAGNLRIGSDVSNSGWSYGGSISEVALYGTALTAAQVQSSTAAMQASDSAKGEFYARPTTNYIAANIAGDSRSYLSLTSGAETAGYWSYLTPLLNPVGSFAWQANNYSVPGQTMLAAYARMGRLAVAPAAAGGVNVYVLQGVANDFFQGEALATMESATGELIKGLSSTGAIVFVGTEQSVNSTTYPTWFANYEVPYNVWLRQNAVALGAKGVFDLAEDARLGPINASLNATYFDQVLSPAGVHNTPTAVSTIWAPAVASAINYYFGNTPTNPDIVTATGASLTPANAYVIAALPASSNLSLPDCQWLTGSPHPFTIVNQGSYSFTVLAVGGESIQPLGGPVAVIDPGVSAVYMPELISSSTGGCQWQRLDGRNGAAQSVLNVSTSVSNNSGGIKHARITVTSTAATAGAYTDTTVIWASPFADANYTVSCTNNANGVGNGSAIASFYGQTAAGFTLRITNTAASVNGGLVDCIAFHD